MLSRNVTALSLFATLAMTSAIACGGTERVADEAAANDDLCMVDCDDHEIDVSGEGSNDGELICADVSVVYEVQTPTVVLLIDQSGSMDESYPGGDRWSVLQDALMNSNDGVVQALQSEVRFGLALYTSYNGFENGAMCPVIDDVDAAFSNYDAINDVYAQAVPEEDTPTGEALVVVAHQLAELDIDGPKIVIVATDGEPDTCAEPDPQNGQAVATAAALEAFDLGVRTFVLGVGDDVGADHLQDMANAGAGVEVDGDVDESYYQPATRDELIDAFADIIHGQRSCSLALDGEIDATIAANGSITLDGATLTYGQDWRLVGSSQIELLGDACESVKTGEHTLEGSFTCPEVVGPIN